MKPHPFCFAIACCSFCIPAIATAGAATAVSPDGRLGLRAELKDGSVRYELNRDGKPLISSSEAGLVLNGKTPVWKHVKAGTREEDKTWKPVWGKQAEIRNQFRELELALEGDGAVAMSVVFRVYDEGLAFRFRLSGADTLKVDGETTEFRFASDGTAWSYNGEQSNKGPEKLSSIKGLRRLPMTVRFGDDSFATVAQAQLENFPWIDLKKNGAGFSADLEACSVPLPFETPWRVVIIGDQPGDLVDASILENLNPPCAIEDPSWVKPGVTFWDWRTWGYKAPDGFEYGLDMASWRRFIDFAAKNEVPYLLLDANWYGPEFDPKEDPTTSRDHLVTQEGVEVVRTPAPADWKDPIDAPELIRYGKEKGVGIFLYINDKARINYDFDKTLATYRKWGAAGIKYGFMEAANRQQKVNKTNEIIRLCAKHELMCNFHDGPLMPNGDYRTWPNCTTREFCHAQADARRSFTPTTLLTSVFVNMVTGPIDMNNGMFALKDAHDLRPRVFEPIPSTIVGECARTLIVFSGQTIIPDAPESLGAQPGLFSFIAAQKQPWLESETLMGEIGEFIVVRRTAADGSVLLGAATNESGRELEVPLAFLGDSKWTATVFEDAADTHFKTNPEAFHKKVLEIDAGGSLRLKLAPGGGACVRFVKH